MTRPFDISVTLCSNAWLCWNDKLASRTTRPCCDSQGSGGDQSVSSTAGIGLLTQI